MIYKLLVVIKNKRKLYWHESYLIFVQNSAFYSNFQIIWRRQISQLNL